MEEVFRKLGWEGRGIKINGCWLHNQRFEDEIVLFNNNLGELKRMVEALDQESKKVGLIVNFEKTKIVTNAKEKDLRIDGRKAEHVSQYKYLGQTVAFKERGNL